MSDFERIQFYYQKGWATDSQLRQYVTYKAITPEQYKVITDQDF
ncbi:XkdX family protein [Paenibacillus pinisoli]|uniref:XkdX family protein n=1 Tax=Paenibacillus pinisoli TaxID=1276110 RepID=A0A3A6PM91_9BACL|nr:XkdX family protein [Paenibacillus pinisoli]RJX40856.1 XkdX family protein [Paenibacillus pinisoli]